MNVLVFLVFVVGILARPDVSELGYQYRPPATSYEAPSGSIESLNQRRYYHVDEKTFHVPATNFQTPVYEHSSFTNTQRGSFPTPTTQPFASRIYVGGGGHNGAAHVSAAGAGSSQTLTQQSGLPTSPFAFGGNTQSHTSGSQVQTHGSRLPTSPFAVRGGQSSSSLNIGGGSQTSSLNVGGSGQSALTPNREGTQRFGPSNFGSSVTAQQGEISKHLYFFAAPEELEQVRPRINVITPPTRKSVKIIFIKAPSSAFSGQITIPAQPQSEEKTVVYVLVKKQDEQTQINVQAPVPAKPTKPEVFFIKYKNQKEAQEAVSNVQSGIVPQGILTNANSVEGDSAFLSTIGQDSVLSQNIAPAGGESSGLVGGGYNLSVGQRSGSTFSVGGYGGGGARETVGGFGSSTLVGPSSSGSFQSSSVAPATSPQIHALYGPPH